MNETDSPPDDRATDGTVERWLQDKVLPAYDAHRADPSRVLTPDEVSGVLSAHHAERSKRRSGAA